MHICVNKLTIIGSDNGLSPWQCQAIIGTNDGILLIRLLGTNFSEILIKICTISFKKMHLKMSSEKWQPFCLGLNVLTIKEIYPVCLDWFPMSCDDLTFLTCMYFLLNSSTEMLPEMSWRATLVIMTLRVQSIRPVQCGQFSPKSPQKKHHSSPTRVRYGMSFVG